MLELLLSITVWLFLSCVAVLGFYKLTRHNLVVMPDNSIVTDGFVLKWWSEFWEATAGVKRWMYQGKQLEEKFAILEISDYKLVETKLCINPEKKSIKILNELTKEELQFIEDHLQVTSTINGDNLFLFLEQPTYVFPEWLRLPISGCPICMASPFGFGGVIWLLFVVLYNLPWSTGLVLWVPFCISLAFLNFLGMKKFSL